jgi:hypothetical protein
LRFVQTDRVSYSRITPHAGQYAMTAQARPIFTADWPRYAKAVHIVFWATSALLLLACAGAYAGIVPAALALTLFIGWLVAVLLMGGAAVCSGKLYRGDQVLRRQPMTGLSARIAGAMVALAALTLLFFAYGLSQLGH